MGCLAAELAVDVALPNACTPIEPEFDLARRPLTFVLDAAFERTVRTASVQKAPRTPKTAAQEILGDAAVDDWEPSSQIKRCVRLASAR